MINLSKLLMTESDATTGVQAGKSGGDSAQDFLALLTGAMTGGQGQESDAPITLADLQAAALSGKLAKGNLAATAATGEETQAQTPAQKLAELLARQSAKSDVMASAASDADVQKLFSGLTPAAKTDVLAALSKTAKATDSENKTDLSDEELAGLSALMAMLPHQQAAQLNTASAQPVSASSGVDVAKAANRALNTSSLTADTDLPRGSTKNDSAAGTTPFHVADDAQQTAVLASSSAAVKKDNDNALQTTNTTASIAPVTTTASAAQASTPVAAPVVSAPLGSHEWQQNISQHVTLFTRQGQQSAELRLHPEDLGQVQISIKLEDNQAQLQMVSAHSHVRQALEAALPMLRTSLAESGIQLGQSNISSESFAGQQQQQQASQQQQQASRSGSGDLFGTDDGDALVAPASLQSAARGNGAVDIFA
ncbi:flagellar hook length control protein FliK [Kosakonia pseudosacchari]|uniref:Flagellar hook-length control protein FliK n=1 Tax=Kosakonia pseudosacchari TaxID=1646340 RepID=A0ABX4IWP3_9ENTR|nr:flagellar hook length control protein FliK [Kosakonia pseudosacchari]PDO90193.1 flagellar hook-length control protein FliK [Kosakonia pseudosacchari]